MANTSRNRQFDITLTHNGNNEVAINIRMSIETIVKYREIRKYIYEKRYRIQIKIVTYYNYSVSYGIIVIACGQTDTTIG